MRILSLLVALVVLSPWAVGAENLAIDSHLSMEFQLPGPRWTFSRQAPDMLVAPMVADVEHDLTAKNQHLSQDQVLAMAQQRLAQNQGYVYNARTGSYLLIDFSPLKPGDKPPTDDDMDSSARYAEEDLKSEPHVTDVQARVSSADIAGARYASRLDASYLQNGQPKSFTGLIGYAHPYWIFLYYTDTGKNPADAREMALLFQSVRLHDTRGNN